MAAPTGLARGQRVKVNLAGLTVRGVLIEQSVQETPGTVLDQVASDPPTYRVELLFTFKGAKRVEVPADRIRPA
jgi:hypothetical protein